MPSSLVKAPAETAPSEGMPVTTSADVRMLNRRLAAERMRLGGRRIQQAFFRCPWPCTRRQYEQVRDRAVSKWIDGMEKQGWTLKSKVYADAGRRRSSSHYSGDWAIPGPKDEVEIPVLAVFQIKKEERLGFEIPVSGAAETTARLDLVKGGSN